jgi:hypothetical protein
MTTETDFAKAVQNPVQSGAKSSAASGGENS